MSDRHTVGRAVDPGPPNTMAARWSMARGAVVDLGAVLAADARRVGEFMWRALRAMAGRR